MGESEVLRTAADIGMPAVVVLNGSAAEDGAVEDSMGPISSDDGRTSGAQAGAVRAKEELSGRRELAVLSAVFLLWLAGSATYIGVYLTLSDYSEQPCAQWELLLPSDLLILPPSTALPPCISPSRARAARVPDSHRTLLLACIIAPVGAWMRYTLTLSNHRTPTFPLYTYLCNLIGSVATIVIYVLLTKVLPDFEASARMGVSERLVVTEWLLTVSLGFCGCLSTVSSFVHEVSNLLKKATLYDAYFYATTTMLSIHGACLIILVPVSVYYSKSTC
jgi:fluoride ion exporter CrcB/FEX